MGSAVASNSGFESDSQPHHGHRIGRVPFLRRFRGILFSDSTTRRRPAHLAAVLGIAAAVVVLRALVYLRFDELAFDSDQAVVGLMATHLARGRAFPLFFYGQTYMLAVTSWVAAPLFLVAGASVFTLRLSVLAWNIAFAWLLVIGLHRDAGLSLWSAAAAALFFLAAPASVATQLIAAQGGIIEPFVYIALLWFFRRRPHWFGIVLAIGFRNREFTMYAVPVLLLLEAVTGELQWARAHEWLIALAMFFVTWESIEALELVADLLGPGTRGRLVGGFAGSQFENLLGRFDWAAGALIDRASRIGSQLLGWFAGATQVDTGLPLAERRWLFWGVAVGAVVLTGRLIGLIVPLHAVRREGSTVLGRLRERVTKAAFALYLLGVGIVATVVFVAGKPVLSGYSRYAVLVLLVPVGLTSSVLALEVRPGLKRVLTVFMIAWGLLEISDHVTVLHAYVSNPPPNTATEVANRLIARQIAVAQAGYWQAYVVTFLSGERVRVASRDFVRVQEYQDLLADRHGEAVFISTQSCPGGEAVGSWFLCQP